MEKSLPASGQNIHNKLHLQLVHSLAINKLMGLKIGIAIVDSWYVTPNSICVFKLLNINTFHQKSSTLNRMI